tara:strand:+ start:145 stop:678 length:534 start_codon:yes stop_codon:yes gene_type:complete
MIQRLRVLSVLLTGILLMSNFALAESQLVDIESIRSLHIRNLTIQAHQVFTGGQPSAEQFIALSELGIKHVVNLRPQQEQHWNEAELLNSLGIQYHFIPVLGAQGVTSANAKMLSDILSSLNDEPVLLHCASGNRVGALIALSSKANGLDAEQSISKGKEWGLTSLEQFVRNKINTD